MNHSCRRDHGRLRHHSLQFASQCSSLHSPRTAALRCSHRRMTTPHRCCTARHRTTARLAPLNPLLISLCPPAKSLNRRGIRPCPWDHGCLPRRSLQLARQCPSLHSTRTAALRRKIRFQPVHRPVCQRPRRGNCADREKTSPTRSAIMCAPSRGRSSKQECSAK